MGWGDPSLRSFVSTRISKTVLMRTPLTVRLSRASIRLWNAHLISSLHNLVLDLLRVRGGLWQGNDMVQTSEEITRILRIVVCKCHFDCKAKLGQAS
eukprot:g68860.t1